MFLNSNNLDNSFISVFDSWTCSLPFNPTYLAYCFYIGPCVIPESVAAVENVLDRDIFAGRRRGDSVPLAMHGSVEARHTNFPHGKPAEQQR